MNPAALIANRVQRETGSARTVVTLAAPTDSDAILRSHGRPRPCEGSFNCAASDMGEAWTPAMVRDVSSARAIGGR